MKILMSIIKHICLGIFGIYSTNVLFSMINIVIPINIYTLFIGSTLGIYGISAIVLLRLLI